MLSEDLFNLVRWIRIAGPGLTPQELSTRIAGVLTVAAVDAQELERAVVPGAARVVVEESDRLVSLAMARERRARAVVARPCGSEPPGAA